MLRRKRLPDGTLGDLEKVGSSITPNEQLELLGMQLAMEKLANMQVNSEKDMIIDSMGAQLVQMRIEVMLLKGGAN